MKLKTDIEVALLQHCGNDAIIVRAAKASFADRTVQTETNVSRLIRYLFTHRHEVPFEHTLLTFEVKVPLFVQQQLLKHRIGVSVSQESHRYVEPGRGNMEVFWPEDGFRKQAASVKQGSSDELVTLDGHDQLALVVEGLDAVYDEMFSQGVCREQARAYLPCGTFTSAIVSFNMRSFLHFLSLRLSPHAQAEIRDLAEQMLLLVEDTGAFPFTLKWALRIIRHRWKADEKLYEVLKNEPLP